MFWGTSTAVGIVFVNAVQATDHKNANWKVSRCTDFTQRQDDNVTTKTLYVNDAGPWKVKIQDRWKYSTRCPPCPVRAINCSMPQPFQEKNEKLFFTLNFIQKWHPNNKTSWNFIVTWVNYFIKGFKNFAESSSQAWFKTKHVPPMAWLPDNSEKHFNGYISISVLSSKYSKQKNKDFDKNKRKNSVESHGWKMHSNKGRQSKKWAQPSVTICGINSKLFVSNSK